MQSLNYDDEEDDYLMCAGPPFGVDPPWSETEQSMIVHGTKHNGTRFALLF